MNCVIIPTFKRPEFLYLTIERILKADHAKDFVYLFAIDHGFDSVALEIIDTFPLDKVKMIRKRNTYQQGKQSHNLLEAYREATYLSDDLIFLLEDDFFINSDFFNWNLKVMAAEPDCFCSISTRNHNTDFKTQDDDSAYYYGSETDYQSWAVCWHKKVLEDLILPHANTSYYNYPQRYIKQMLYTQWMGDNFCEQDGLIRRIRYANKQMKVIYAHKPRAFHAGFYSYNRGQKYPTGSIQDKINHVRKITGDPVLFKEACGSFNDSEPIDLEYKFTYNKPTLIQP